MIQGHHLNQDRVVISCAFHFQLNPDSVVFQHYTDGKEVATRCIANIL